jgi:outer membrane receptor protein involved in Fe transport
MCRMPFAWGICVFSLTAMLAQTAFAQSVETVLVTAAPPDPVGNEAFSVTRLDAGELGSAPELDVSLEQVPGLSLYRRNSSLSANPTTQGVSLREIAPSAAGRALVTLDGVPQNDPFGGWVIWSALPSEDIASAEIVRGAGAGPYGAGALTGTIALQEAGQDALAADASGGELGFRRAAASGGTDLGGLSLFGSASEEASDGWVSVSPLQAGAADDKVTLDARNASLRADFEPETDTLVSTRLGAYDEHRQSGVVGTASDAFGYTASVTVAHPPGDDELGWRMQLWLHDSGLSNTSATIGPGRATATPSDDQYATPALGLGANAALRGEGFVDWEIGADVRSVHGQSDEYYSYGSGAYTMGRVSGGDGLTAGIYGEAARRTENWLFTLGLRADHWESTDGHLVQTVLSSGAATTNEHWASRSGTVPTARAGVRRDFDGGFYLRAATYEGFRAPSLNELYRPFRLGNNVTEANPALTPEKLYGAEIGAGGVAGSFVWNLTAFWNQLHGAISNVTVGHGPATFPDVGFVPAGGLLIERQNVGDIDAPGLEGDAHYRLGPVTLRAAFEWLQSRVQGGVAAPQLTGKRPAQAPPLTVTGGFDALLCPALTLSADARYEGTRYADDANTLALAPAFTLDTKLSWAASERISFYVAADNLFNTRVATTESADGVVNYDAPRLISAGVSFKPAP